MQSTRRMRRIVMPLLAVLAVVAAAGLWAIFAPDTLADNSPAAEQGNAAARPDDSAPKPAEPADPQPDTASAPPPAASEQPVPASESVKPAGESTAQPSQALWVDVDLSQQRVLVKAGDQLVKEMVTSSGAPGYETPQGTFQVENRGDWFYSGKYEEGAKWWVSFKGWGQYLFHSIVMDEDQQVIEAEAAKLGTPASHGCLRLAVDDAKWIYDNVPQGAKVVIHA